MFGLLSLWFSCSSYVQLLGSTSRLLFVHLLYLLLSAGERFCSTSCRQECPYAVDLPSQQRSPRIASSRVTTFLSSSQARHRFAGHMVRYFHRSTQIPSMLTYHHFLLLSLYHIRLWDPVDNRITIPIQGDVPISIQHLSSSSSDIKLAPQFATRDIGVSDVFHLWAPVFARLHPFPMCPSSSLLIPLVRFYLLKFFILRHNWRPITVDATFFKFFINSGLVDRPQCPHCSEPCSKPPACIVFTFGFHIPHKHS